MKALLTVAALALIGGTASLSAQCGCGCPPPPPVCYRPCPVYTCAGSQLYQDYWNNQVYYKGSPNMDNNGVMVAQPANGNTNKGENPANNAPAMKAPSDKK